MNNKKMSNYIKFVYSISDFTNKCLVDTGIREFYDDVSLKYAIGDVSEVTLKTFNEFYEFTEQEDTVKEIFSIIGGKNRCKIFEEFGRRFGKFVLINVISKNSEIDFEKYIDLISQIEGVENSMNMGNTNPEDTINEFKNSLNNFKKFFD